MNALFNDNNELIGYSDMIPPNISKYKDLGDIDLNKQFWEGDYETGEVKNISDIKIKISAYELQQNLVSAIKEHQNFEFLNLLLMKQIYTISQNMNCLNDDFKTYMTPIINILGEYNKIIEELQETDKLL